MDQHNTSCLGRQALICNGLWSCSEPSSVPAVSSLLNPVLGASKVSPGAEHALEKHQRKYTPPPPGKFALLKITALPSYFL